MYYSILFSATLVFADSTGHINHFDGGLLMFLGLSSRLVFLGLDPKDDPDFSKLQFLLWTRANMDEPQVNIFIED